MLSHKRPSCSRLSRSTGSYERLVVVCDDEMSQRLASRKSPCNEQRMIAAGYRNTFQLSFIS